MLAMVLPMMPGCEALFKIHLFGFPLDELLKWAFATPVQFWIGWRFHSGAVKALRNGRYGKNIKELLWPQLHWRHRRCRQKGTGAFRFLKCSQKCAFKV